jgi:hypothetical protein
LFWILRVPEESVDIEDEEAKARMTLTNLEIEDYHDLLNALLDGPSVPAHVSVDVHWSNRIATSRFRNAAPDQRFTGLFTQTHATIRWSALEAGFEYHSDPANTSTAVYAEVGHERNGVFF